MLGSGREMCDFWDGSELIFSDAFKCTASMHGLSRFKSIRLLLLSDDDGSDGSLVLYSKS